MAHTAWGTVCPEETHPGSNKCAGKYPKPPLLKVLGVALPCWKLLRTLSKRRDLRCWYNRKKVSNTAMIMSRKVPRKNTTAEQQENRKLWLTDIFLCSIAWWGIGKV